MAVINSFLSVASGAALSGAIALTPVSVAFKDGGAIAVMPTGRVGSGGVASPEAMFARHAWTDSGGNVSVSPGLPVTPNEQLAYVRRTLGISMTDLAEVLDVTRPTIYAWLQGAEPRAEYLDRLIRLVRMASEIDAFGLDELGKLLKRPLQDGRTVLALIKDGQPIASAMKELEVVARREHRQRASLKGGKNNLAAADAPMEQSMPGYLARI